MKKFELATDECLLVFDKVEHDQENKLYKQAQDQFVLIYNESAIRCLQSGFHDDAIALLNRAIQQQKNIGELYLNRGGSSFDKNRSMKFSSRFQIVFSSKVKWRSPYKITNKL